MNQKLLYHAYRRGYRTAKRGMRYNYTMNPYPHSSMSWYMFNHGWNDFLTGIII